MLYVSVYNIEHISNYMKYVNRLQEYIKCLLQQDNLHTAKMAEQNLSVGLTHYT